MVQAIFNGALRRGEYGRLCRRLRRWILKFSDPLVLWELNGRPLRLPLSHQLPFYRREYPTYSANLERLAAFIRVQQKRLIMIDVGANVGDSLALAAVHPEDAFLLIEGDPRYFDLLRQNAADLPRAKCLQTMLSDQAGDSAVRLVTTEGTGKLVATDSAGDGARLQTLDEVLDGDPQFRATGLLKIDVDGYDFRVLRGAERFVRAAQPVIFFEQDPNLLEPAGEEPDEVWTWLAGAGYQDVFLYDNVGFLLGAFPLRDAGVLRQLNSYARQHPGFYYDVAAFAPGHTALRKAFELLERQFYRELTSRSPRRRHSKPSAPVAAR